MQLLTDNTNINRACTHDAAYKGILSWFARTHTHTHTPFQKWRKTCFMLSEKQGDITTKVTNKRCFVLVPEGSSLSKVKQCQSGAFGDTTPFITLSCGAIYQILSHTASDSLFFLQVECESGFTLENS